MRAHIFFINNLSDGYLPRDHENHAGYHSAADLLIADDTADDIADVNEIIYTFMQNDNPRFKDIGWIERQDGGIKVDYIFTERPRSMSVGDMIVFDKGDGKVVAKFQVAAFGFDKL
jgi:hypothetical protein